jgi:hypothetical protein
MLIEETVHHGLSAMGDNMMKTEIVVTTIGTLDFLEKYEEHFKTYSHDDVGFIVVADRKTPDEKNIHFLQNLNYPVKYLTLKDQKSLMEGTLSSEEQNKIFPENDDCRRSLGYLLAHGLGASSIISIDDDNFPCQDEDWLTEHEINHRISKVEAVDSSTRWVNPAGFAKKGLYSRGFPLTRRGETLKKEHVSGKILLNVGLWYNDPDIDAISRMIDPNTLEWRPYGHVVVSSKNFLPIHSQNTAFSSDLLPCMYFYPKQRIGDFTVHRYGDIWMGYFVKACMNANRDLATLGAPCANHMRNKHILSKDLSEEAMGMLLSSWLCTKLEQTCLAKGKYVDVYARLLDELDKSNFSDRILTGFFNELILKSRLWLKLVERTENKPMIPRR